MKPFNFENSFKFITVGQHKIEQLDKVMLQLHEVYGKIGKTFCAAFFN